MISKLMCAVLPHLCFPNHRSNRTNNPSTRSSLSPTFFSSLSFSPLGQPLQLPPNFVPLIELKGVERVPSLAQKSGACFNPTYALGKACFVLVLSFPSHLHLTYSCSLSISLLLFIEANSELDLTIMPICESPLQRLYRHLSRIFQGSQQYNP